MELTRSMKRVAVIVLLAIVVILVSKSLLLKSVKNLNAEAEKQQQAKALKDAATLPVAAEKEAPNDAPASTTTEVIEPESAAVATEDSAITP